jgi:parallel beta-helix repeat protein
MKSALALLLVLLGSSALAQPAPLWRADFEDGKLPQAVIPIPAAGCQTLDDAVAFRGGKSLLHVHSGDVKGNYVENSVVLPVVLKKGVRYTFSCWVKGEITEGGVRIGVQFAGGAFEGTRIDKAFDWTQFTCAITPAADIANAQLRMGSWPGYGLVWFDEAALVEGDKALPPPEGAPRDDRTPREVFVSPAGGLDSNDGASPERAFKAVRAALLWACPGSTITLLPGFYPGDITLKAGLKEKPITLRAQRKGRVFIGATTPVAGFERVAGMEYTWSAPVSSAPATLSESDTGRALRHMASVADVEELAGSYFHDGGAKRIYVHPTDSAGVAHHTYEPVNPGVGVRMADYTVVDGLTLTGFGDAAIRSVNAEGVVVQNCVAHHNGYGIEFRDGSDCVIRNNEVRANRPSYDEGAQIHISGAGKGAERFVVEGNYAHDSPRIGIRFYSGRAKDCTFRGNLVQRCAYGFWFKMNQTEGGLLAERNVSFGNATHDLGAPIMRHNTYGVFGGERSVRGDTDLITREFKGDARFADAAHNDFRLQGDSPARGKAPDGSDLGAFGYDDSVRYVRPDGDDAGDGASLARAWKTLEHATKSLKAGQTLYIEPGEWRTSLVLERLKSTSEKPTRVRVRGKAGASMQTVLVQNCANIELDGLRARPPEGSKGHAIHIRSSENVLLRECAATKSADDGVCIVACKRVTLDHCAMADNALSGLGVGGSTDVALLSSLVARNGSRTKSPQVNLAEETYDFYSEFNAFVPTRASPLYSRGTREMRDYPDLKAWRAASGLDTQSLEVLPTAIPGLDKGDFRVPTGTPLSFAGRFNTPVGPDGPAPAERAARKAIERVEVVSTTPTSANVTFWTPGLVAGTVIEWGKSEKYGSLHDRASEPYGEYETFHTVSLVGLEPGTTYHFRVGFRDFTVPIEQKVNGQDPIRWSGDFTLTTAAKELDARDLFVAVDGDDARDGLSPASAWRTLRKAAREARAGDTVTLAPGRYMEPLRPLQTGTSEKRRITFRAESPLTVFLDGGLIKFVREGRPYGIAVESKAWLSFENLTCERNSHYDFGGYRGGVGYSGQISVSGSAAVEFKGCVMDGRSRWMGNLWLFEAGKMPGVPAEQPAITVTDSLLLNGWRALGINATRPCVFRNCAFARSMTGMITELGGGAPKLVIRDTVIHSLILSKKGNVLVNHPGIYDTDYNCFVWDAENDKRYIARDLPALAGWREKTQLDAHSIETDPGWPLSRKLGYGNRGEVDLTPLAISDLILPPGSPCRGTGEGGGNIGPRWEPYLEKKP